MAEVRISDVVEPVVFEAYTRQMTTELWSFYQSGIVQNSAYFDQLARQEGSLINIPYWDDLASVESNVGSDNPASFSTPQKIGTGQIIGVKNRRNQSWSSMDLVAALLADDPMREIGGKVARYWVRDYQNTLIAACNGVLADNIANDAGDMLNDIGTDAVGAPAAAELISADAVIDTWATLGDAQGKLVGIAMHSVPYFRLQKQDLIDFIQPSGTDVRVPTYLGLRVVVDDGLPAVAGTNRIKYTSVLFGNGAFGWGNGSPKTPVEVDRAPSAGDGEGQETLYNRKHYFLHPRGFSFISGSMAGVSPTNAEFALAANWNRLWERKNIPLAFLKTNG